MKNILNLLLSSFFVTVALLSCKKDEHKIFLEDSTAPVLTSSVTSPDLPLSYSNKDKEALKLSWTNPDYKFTTGVSSQDVSYQIEIDTAGANFTNPKKQTVSVSKELSKTFMVSEFNGFLLNQLQLDTIVHNIEIRVKSFLGNGSVVLYSNVLKYTVIPYAIPPVVTPPAAGSDLYIVGDATPGGWPPLTNDPAIEKFTRVSQTEFKLTIKLNGGKEYKLVEVPGQWDQQWSVKTENTVDNATNLDLYFNGGNCKAPASDGTYNIDVDFQRGKITLTQ